MIQASIIFHLFFFIDFHLFFYDTLIYTSYEIQQLISKSVLPNQEKVGLQLGFMEVCMDIVDLLVDIS